MIEINSSVFGILPLELGESLENKKISMNLLEALEKSGLEFNTYKNLAKEEKDTLVKLKLYSISKVCENIANSAKEELKKAIERKENPTTLEKLEDCIVGLSDIGCWLSDSIENGNLYSEINDIYKAFLNVQEISENLAIIESLDSKVQKIPESIRGRVLSRFDELTQ